MNFWDRVKGFGQKAGETGLVQNFLEGELPDIGVKRQTIIDLSVGLFCAVTAPIAIVLLIYFMTKR